MTRRIEANGKTADMLSLTNDVLVAYKALYIGSTGDVVVDLEGGSEKITFKTVPVGFFPVSVTCVYSTSHGTSASNIVGLNW